jgi:hypothetical protein
MLKLAAAAAQAPTVPGQHRQARASGLVDSQLAGQQEQQQAQSAGLGAAAPKAAAAEAAAGKHAKASEQLLTAVALLPDKVRSPQQKQG